MTEWTPVLGAMLQALWVRLLGVTRRSLTPRLASNSKEHIETGKQMNQEKIHSSAASLHRIMKGPSS